MNAPRTLVVSQQCATLTEILSPGYYSSEKADSGSLVLAEMRAFHLDEVVYGGGTVVTRISKKSPEMSQCPPQKRFSLLALVVAVNRL